MLRYGWSSNHSTNGGASALCRWCSSFYRLDERLGNDDQCAGRGAEGIPAANRQSAAAAKQNCDDIRDSRVIYFRCGAYCWFMWRLPNQARHAP